MGNNSFGGQRVDRQGHEVSSTVVSSFLYHTNCCHWPRRIRYSGI